MTRPSGALLLLLLSGCAPTGSWSLTGSGGSFVEEGIPSSAMQDGCSVSFDRFLISWEGRFIEGSGGVHLAEVEGAQIYDLALPGPHDVGTADGVPEGDHDHIHSRFQPNPGATAGNVDDDTAAELVDGGLSMLLEGGITCGADAVDFSWAFDRATSHHCFAAVPVIGGETTTTAYTLASERMFSTALQDFEAPLRGQPFVDADADLDGQVTLDELASIDIDSTGYDLATWTGIGTFADYVTVQTFYFVQTDGLQCVPELLD